MKWNLSSLLAALFSTVLLSGSASADIGARHRSGALGFRGAEVETGNAAGLGITAPLGFRWWLGGQKVGIDAGFGFSSHKDVASDENLLNWSLEAGVPVCVKTWDRVHFLFRPGINLASQGVLVPSVPPGGPPKKDSDLYITVTAELETEIFIVDNVSISASQGLGIVNRNPALPGADSTTDFTTFGNNFTSLGFHVYLFGGEAEPKRIGRR